MRISNEGAGLGLVCIVRWFMFKVVMPVEDYFFFKMLDRIHPGHDVE